MKTINNLYEICRKYQFFTSGDIKQYEKLYDKNNEQASIEALALIIWICSKGYTEHEICDILKKERESYDFY